MRALPSSALSAFFISFTLMVTLWILPVNLDFASEPIASTTGKDTDNRHWFFYSLAGLLCMAILSFLISSGESFGRSMVRVSLSSLPVNRNGG